MTMKNAFFALALTLGVTTLPAVGHAKVTLYQHCGYKGYSITLAPGNYNLGRLRRLGMKNDDISALAVSKGYSITIYEHAGYRGKALTFKTHAKCLVRYGFNDKISSVVVRKLPQKVPVVASVYKHCGYKGRRVDLKPGAYTLRMLRRLGMKNDDISSIVLARGYKAILYQHDNFKGLRLTLKKSDSCFVDNNFNDVTSSIVIMKK